MARAVVFDLWGTLIDWPEEASRRLRTLGEPVGDHVRGARRALVRVRSVRGAGERPAPTRAGVDGRRARRRRDRGRAARLAARSRPSSLTASPSNVEALVELRRRGLRLGLVSNCTEDIAIVWPETDLAPLFDAAVFSARAGYMKPAREIYELALLELGVSPSDALFVGDGANGELQGAARVGMTSADPSIRRGAALGRVGGLERTKDHLHPAGATS